MTVIAAAPGSPPGAWTCPFCSLLCDHLQVQGVGQAGPLSAAGAGCALATASLARFDGLAAPASCRVDDAEVSLDDAIAAAAGRLAAARQPLFGGLGTDVAGARALYRLACLTGAIADAGGSESLMQGLRALQDRGGFTTTLAEVRERGELIVCLGDAPTAAYPLLWQRCGLNDTEGPSRRVVLLGGAADAGLAGLPAVRCESVALQGDLLDTVSILVALAEGRPLPAAAPALAALARDLLAARYSVLLWDAAALPPQAGLLIEAVQRLVTALNRSTRAGAFALGGGNGSATVNQTFSWLSGLPLRSRPGPRGLEHEPLLYDGTALLADRAVDLLLWVSCFDPRLVPPPTEVPRIVIGHPALGASLRGPGVFIPVATPGVGVSGHLFRTDGVVLMPLAPLRADTLPSLADVVGRLGDGVRAAHGGGQ